MPAAYLQDDDDDEDVSLNIDGLDALTDDELADLLAGRNSSGYTEEELLRKVKKKREQKKRERTRRPLSLSFSLTHTFSPQFQLQLIPTRSEGARRPSEPPSRPSSATRC